MGTGIVGLESDGGVVVGDSWLAATEGEGLGRLVGELGVGCCTGAHAKASNASQVKRTWRAPTSGW